MKEVCENCGIPHRLPTLQEEVREATAALVHEEWAHWFKYMMANMTTENVARWRRQAETPYVDLTEKEKESDRVWADRFVKEILG